MDAVAAADGRASACARRRGASAPPAPRRRRRSGCRRRASSCTARQVSSTSDEVMPWCTKRASGPTISARWVRKAMTSCLVSRSISSMRVDVERRASRRPSPRWRAAASFGHHAELGQRVGGMRLDLEPDAEAVLRRPDRGHLGAGIAGDHGGVPAAVPGRPNVRGRR